jgi:ABC-type Fe2+-enterobactin transport system substrate-binding protein
MYALRFTNLRNFSKHQIQHLQKQAMQVMQQLTWPPPPVAVLSRRSAISISVRINLQIAIITDPFFKIEM